jgi:hypothetical protein
MTNCVVELKISFTPYEWQQTVCHYEEICFMVGLNEGIEAMSESSYLDVVSQQHLCVMREGNYSRRGDKSLST